ncbi:dimethyladenosine transferase [Bombiscardovia coagulans]|uniref:Ribosomal RNA small subunit methyltransferase A n=2 Tax=Bombiscardovia coagulans TaxID=686666 RepID=A0A261EQQ5_9BIFI|nr:dimethyladenosine transferase [Bombiscardovia coagulans]
MAPPVQHGHSSLKKGITKPMAEHTSMNTVPKQPALAAADSPVHEENGQLLGATDIRSLAEHANIKPTKKLGQNFVIDPGTVRRIVRIANVHPASHVIEVGPGLGSLTLGLLEAGATVHAVEIDPNLAALLPQTVEAHMPQAANHLKVINQDALTFKPQDCPELTEQTSLTLVSNLPYNVATPIILTLLERFSNLSSFVVMVQKEVADRLVAGPSSKTYGVPSAKLAWYGQANLAGRIGRHVFWPAPNVDSALVSFERRAPLQSESERQETFHLIDAAFAQRRKTLRAALHGLVEPADFQQAAIDPQRRGETLSIQEFVRLSHYSASSSQDRVEAARFKRG